MDIKLELSARTWLSVALVAAMQAVVAQAEVKQALVGEKAVTEQAVDQVRGAGEGGGGLERVECALAIAT